MNLLGKSQGKVREFCLKTWKSQGKIVEKKLEKSGKSPGKSFKLFGENPE